jgi:hypothetical protein
MRRSETVVADVVARTSEVGIGTRMTLTEWGFLEFDWGRELKEATRIGDHDPQDDGLHFRVSLD